MKIGDKITVYDGDTIGYTTATLTELLFTVNGNEKWKMTTAEDYQLERFVKQEDVFEDKVIIACPYCDGRGYNDLCVDLGNNEYADFYHDTEPCKACEAIGVLEDTVKPCGHCGEKHPFTELFYDEGFHRLSCNKCYKPVEHEEDEDY